jgi:hypothetical protein
MSDIVAERRLRRVAKGLGLTLVQNPNCAGLFAVVDSDTGHVCEGGRFQNTGIFTFSIDDVESYLAELTDELETADADEAADAARDDQRGAIAA